MCDTQRCVREGKVPPGIISGPIKEHPRVLSRGTLRHRAAETLPEYRARCSRPWRRGIRIDRRWIPKRASSIRVGEKAKNRGNVSCPPNIELKKLHRPRESRLASIATRAFLPRRDQSSKLRVFHCPSGSFSVLNRALIFVRKTITVILRKKISYLINAE